jgi:RNA polymerase sigma-70 factor, ECF subfamily
MERSGFCMHHSSTAATHLHGLEPLAATIRLELPSTGARVHRTKSAPIDTPESLAKWVRAAQEGDQAAQRDLVLAYQKRIAAFIYTIVAPSDEVEDLCQAVFIKMVRSLGSLRHSDQFESWLFRMAKHACLDQLRRRKVRSVFTAFLPQHAQVAEPSGAIDAEELDALRYALAQLKPRERILLALVQEGRSSEEMSELLSINEAAVKARIHRARLRLREHYEPRHS